MSLEQIPFCDIFRPTEKEFQCFEKYIEKCEAKAKSGIIKIIPPKSWVPRKKGYDNLELMIPHPVEQTISGSNGFYEVLLLQREAKPLSKYKKNVINLDRITDNKTPLQCEKLFWKTLKFSSPFYGADTPYSIFDENIQWNLNELDSTLTRGLQKNIQGVTSPYLYIGSWKTMFCWHKEDLDLYSINYNHFGKPKCWYGIPPSESSKLDELAEKHFSDSKKKCSEFMRHKTYLIHPEVLMKNGITIHRCVQEAGEFVVTFASAYHAGFNFGFNCAEAVNFATKRWVNIMKDVKPCICQKNTVQIDQQMFLNNLKKDKSKLEIEPENEKTTQTLTKKRNRTKENKQYDYWSKCENCAKWRKLPKNLNTIDSKRNFKCSKLPKMSCKKKEENWQNKD